MFISMKSALRKSLRGKSMTFSMDEKACFAEKIRNAQKAKENRKKDIGKNEIK